MAGFFNKLVEGVKKTLQNDTLWSAMVSWFDPEIRRWSEECALVIREQASARGIILSNENQRKLAERILASLRGVFERLANNHVQSKTMVVILEKVFNDIPDFMATVLFSDEREFQMWLRLRAERGISLASKRNVPIASIAAGEREFSSFYAEVRRASEEALGRGAVIPEGLIERNEERFQSALRGEFVPREGVFQPMSAAAGKLKAKMKASLDKATDFLENVTHMDFGEEQRTTLETKEAELARLKRERRFRGISEDLDRRIAEERRRSKR
jgi:hypothetical protein